MTGSLPPLLLDATLGRLARWLRMLGYDAAYAGTTDPILVLRRARSEMRVVLTRCRALQNQRGITVLLISSESLEKQIDEVVTAFGLPAEDMPQRCPVCNNPLEALSHAAACGQVPPYIWRTTAQFSRCPGCRRIYWPGSHWQGIKATAKRFLHTHLPGGGEE